MATHALSTFQATYGRVCFASLDRFLRRTRICEAPQRGCARSMPKGILVLGLLLPPLVVGAQRGPGPRVDRAARAWSVTITGGYTNTFQMILGDTFGTGRDIQDKLTVSMNNTLLTGDSVSVFGWSTTDTSSLTPNRQFGLLYKLPILRRSHPLTLTVGGQRWLLPLVATGTNDWFATGNLTWATSVRRVPLFISEDSYSLVKSNLPTGSALYSQIYTENSLMERRGLRITLREGPAYTYSWGLYGLSGNRVVRYGGMLVASRKSMALEAGYRKQFGLQDGIPNNGYWTFLLTRKFTASLHRE